jgi:hypothetical protein
MKELALGVVVILVLGVGGFLYRNTMERPIPGPNACTLEAKLCPDGSGVGRSGPDCSFAPCAFPNVEIPEAGISFAVPPEYEQVLTGAPNQETLRIFSKPSLSPSVQHTIHVKRYTIPAGTSPDDVILAATRYQPADMQAEDFSRFTFVNLGGRTYRVTVIERFEALVQSSYFLTRDTDVIRFDVVEHDVTNWTDPNLVVDNLPEHRALQTMLGTLQGN